MALCRETSFRQDALDFVLDGCGALLKTVPQTGMICAQVLVSKEPSSLGWFQS